MKYRQLQQKLLSQAIDGKKYTYYHKSGYHQYVAKPLGKHHHRSVSKRSQAQRLGLESVNGEGSFRDSRKDLGIESNSRKAYDEMAKKKRKGGAAVKRIRRRNRKAAGKRRERSPSPQRATPLPPPPPAPPEHSDFSMSSSIHVSVSVTEMGVRLPMLNQATHIDDERQSHCSFGGSHTKSYSIDVKPRRKPSQTNSLPLLMSIPAVSHTTRLNPSSTRQWQPRNRYAF